MWDRGVGMEAPVRLRDLATDEGWLGRCWLAVSPDDKWPLYCLVLCPTSLR
jgi:hypothetical protein